MSFFIGLLAGFFGGMVGLGGGVVMIPLMVGLLKLSQHKAHGTSLVAVFFTGSWEPSPTASRAPWTSRPPSSWPSPPSSPPAWGPATPTAPGSVAQAGLRLVSLPRLLSPPLKALPGPQGPGARGAGPRPGLLLSGAFTGFLSGMMGVGGGTIMVPAMVLLLGMPQHTAQGTSLLAMVPASLVGAYTHFRLGNVEEGLALGLVPGVFLGTFLGGELAHFLPETGLRLVFAAVLLWTAWRYLRPSFQKK